MGEGQFSIFRRFPPCQIGREMGDVKRWVHMACTIGPRRETTKQQQQKKKIPSIAHVAYHSAALEVIPARTRHLCV